MNPDLRRRTMRFGRAGMAATVALACLTVASAVGAAGRPSAEPADAHNADDQRPSRVLVVLIDGMRPEMADRLDMPNFREMRDEGVNFENGVVGHLTATTVIAHRAIVTGLEPRHMGWTDEMYRDVDNVLGGGAGELYGAGSLTLDQFGALSNAAGYPSLSDYLRAASPRSKFITVGYKSYVPDSVAGNAPAGDIAVRMSGRQPAAECPELGGRWRYPVGLNVPTYLTEPKCGRFYVNSDPANHYGTAVTSPAWTNPLDGNRPVPGFDSEHLGGDAWATDAAIEMMHRENWNGMFVSLGGLDKASHMWGPDDFIDLPPGAEGEQTHVRFQARHADAQLGRLTAALEDLGILDETLVVLTSDHGAMSASRAWYGNDAPGQGWVGTGFGNVVNEGNATTVLPPLQPIIDAGNVQGMVSGNMISQYLVNPTKTSKRQAANVLRDIPGVIATYWRDGNRYRLDSSNTGTKMTASEREWWKARAQGLVDTMAADYGPDVIGLMADNHGYGGYGDHGGAQEADQRIPMVFWSQDIDNEAPRTYFRQRDILPTILDALDIDLTRQVDGRAFDLEFDD